MCHQKPSLVASEISTAIGDNISIFSMGQQSGGFDDTMSMSTNDTMQRPKKKKRSSKLPAIGNKFPDSVRREIRRGTGTVMVKAASKDDANFALMATRRGGIVVR